jgi:uncharacterized protein DUF4382
MRRQLIASLAIAALAGCGSSDGNGGTGRMNVRLVDAPADYQEVNLDVQRVQIRSDGDWVTLGTPDRVVNLLALTGGVSTVLADGATLPAGTYGQLRLVLGPDNTVKLTDGSIHALKVPSGAQSGVKLNVHFDVQPGTTKDVFVDFDAHRSIFVHQAGNSGKYMMRPVVRAYDRAVTGSVSGKIADLGGTGLPGVTVTAQALDASGTPSVVRSVTTALDGSYTLDLLPIGGTYHVVTQPVVGGTSYAARASEAIVLTAATPVAAFSASVSIAPQVADVSGAITPPAGESDGDVVAIRQLLDAGGVSRLLIVREQPAIVLDGLELYAMPGVPAGSSSVVVTRRTIGLDGEETVRASLPLSVTVPPAGAVTADLALP